MTYVLLVITFLFAGINAFADDHVQLRRAGLAEYEKGHYTQAEALIRKALNWAQGTTDEYCCRSELLCIGRYQSGANTLA